MQTQEATSAKGRAEQLEQSIAEIHAARVAHDENSPRGSSARDLALAHLGQGAGQVATTEDLAKHADKANRLHETHRGLVRLRADEVEPDVLREVIDEAIAAQEASSNRGKPLMAERDVVQRRLQEIDRELFAITGESAFQSSRAHAARVVLTEHERGDRTSHFDNLERRLFAGQVATPGAVATPS